MKKSKKLIKNERSNKPVIFNDNGIKDFDELKASSVVMIAYASEKIKEGLAALYCAISCQLKEKYEEGEVHSVRWEGSGQKFTKGYPGGFFPNAMIIDLWMYQRNQHTKVFLKKGTIQLCGMPTKEAGEKIANRITEIINQASEYINKLSTDIAYRQQFQEASSWLIDNSLGPEGDIIESFFLKNDSEFGNMKICKKVTVPLLKLPAINSVPEKFKDILKDLYDRCDDLECSIVPHKALIARINSLLSYSKMVDNYHVTNVGICSFIYDYNIGMMIDRYTMEQKMKSLGYDTYYPNDCSSYVLIHIISNLKFNVDELVRKDKSGLEKFKFYPFGAVRHTGPSIDLMRDSYTKIMNDLYKMRDQIKI